MFLVFMCNVTTCVGEHGPGGQVTLKKDFFFFFSNWTDKGELKTLPNTDWCFQPVTGVLFVAQHDWMPFMRKRHVSHIIDQQLIYVSLNTSSERLAHAASQTGTSALTLSTRVSLTLKL